MSDVPEVTPDWRVRQEQAQRATTYTIAGHVYPRIPWGQEHRLFAEMTPTNPDTGRSWFDDPCGDCDVTAGQFHVMNCDMEECPICGEQLISCPHFEQIDGVK